MSKLDCSIYCPYCHRHTSLQGAPAAFRDAYGTTTYSTALWKQSEYSFWWIGICNNCHNPVLVQNSGKEVYPRPLPSPTDERIPDNIRKDLIEAKICFSVQAYRGCAVMARRVMQTTCLDKGAKKKDLVDQLHELQDAGIITKDIKEWADVVRWVGNDAAHPNKDEVTMEDGQDILKLAEQFLHVIYVAPAIAREHREKKGK